VLDLSIACISVSFFLETSTIEELDLSSDIDNSSVTMLEKQVDAQHESSGIQTQQTARAGTYSMTVLSCSSSFSFKLPSATNTHEKGIEPMVKKAMQNIMAGKSVIYTKTDLTQLCNKPNIRLEAVKRLVEANLLRHGNNFWVEPNRTRKESKKDSKRILREGWLKY
jgi:hypothetical protein